MSSIMVSSHSLLRRNGKAAMSSIMVSSQFIVKKTDSSYELCHGKFPQFIVNTWRQL